MCRDAHLQRSSLVKRCKSSWIFHCFQGKDKSKPFDWVIPDRTISGSQVSHKMMQFIRKRPQEGEPPWLIPQWGSCTEDPTTGQYWRNKAQSPTQMKEGRKRTMRLPPLCSKIELDCCSYVARRAGSGVLAFLDASPMLRNAFGNWKEHTEVKKQGSVMPDRYFENQLQLSFVSKYLVAGWPWARAAPLTRLAAGPKFKSIRPLGA